MLTEDEAIREVGRAASAAGVYVRTIETSDDAEAWIAALPFVMFADGTQHPTQRLRLALARLICVLAGDTVSPAASRP